jgi:hypothetical protein
MIAVAIVIGLVVVVGVVAGIGIVVGRVWLFVRERRGHQG